MKISNEYIEKYLTNNLNIAEKIEFDAALNNDEALQTVVRIMRVRRYIQQQMSEEEEKKYLADLCTDRALREEHELLIGVNAAVEYEEDFVKSSQEAINFVQKLNKKRKNKNRFRWAIMVSVIVATLLGLVWSKTTKLSIPHPPPNNHPLIVPPRINEPVVTVNETRKAYKEVYETYVNRLNNFNRIHKIIVTLENKNRQIIAQKDECQGTGIASTSTQFIPYLPVPVKDSINTIEEIILNPEISILEQEIKNIDAEYIKSTKKVEELKSVINYNKKDLEKCLTEKKEG